MTWTRTGWTPGRREPLPDLFLVFFDLVVVSVDGPGVFLGELAAGAVGLSQGEVGLAGATDLLMAALLELPCLAESPGPSTSGHVKPPPSMSPGQRMRRRSATAYRSGRPKAGPAREFCART